MVIHERVDKVIAMLMEKLEMPIPEFRRSYRLRLIYDGRFHDAEAEHKPKLTIDGVDILGQTYKVFKKLTITGLSEEPVSFPMTKG